MKKIILTEESFAGRINRFTKSPRIIIPILIYLILIIPIIWFFSSSPPETEVQVYKGVWLPFTWPTYIASMKDTGVNTISLEQAVHSPLKALLVANIKTAHRNDMRVMLSSGYMEPYPEPEDIDLEDVNSEIIKLAELAEKYEVEFFAPFLDPDCIFQENSTKWMQELLPKIKEVYHGEVIWKGGLDWTVYYGRLPSKDWPTNFSGYDYIGFSLTPHGNMTLEDYSRFVDKVLNITLFWAERDNCKGVMITEFGVWGWGPHLEKLGRLTFADEYSEEEIARAYEIVLEKGKDKVVGFFPYGMKWDIFGEKGFYGKREELIRKWYTEILP